MPGRNSSGVTRLCNALPVVVKPLHSCRLALTLASLGLFEQSLYLGDERGRFARLDDNRIEAALARLIELFDMGIAGGGNQRNAGSGGGLPETHRRFEAGDAGQFEVEDDDVRE